MRRRRRCPGRELGVVDLSLQDVHAIRAPMMKRLSQSNSAVHIIFTLSHAEGILNLRLDVCLLAFLHSPSRTRPPGPCLRLRILAAVGPSKSNPRPQFGTATLTVGLAVLEGDVRQG